MAAATEAIFNIDQVAFSKAQRAVAASTTIYQGTLVGINSSGYLVPMSDTAGVVFDGVALETIDNSAGANAAKTCDVLPIEGLQPGQCLEVNAASPAIGTWLRKLVYAADDQTAQLDAGSTNKNVLGRCVAVNVTGSSGRILINPHDKSGLNAAAVTS